MSCVLYYFVYLFTCVDPLVLLFGLFSNCCGNWYVSPPGQPPTPFAGVVFSHLSCMCTIWLISLCVVVNVIPRNIPYRLICLDFLFFVGTVIIFFSLDNFFLPFDEKQHVQLGYFLSVFFLRLSYNIFFENATPRARFVVVLLRNLIFFYHVIIKFLVLVPQLLNCYGFRYIIFASSSWWV